jgi:cell division protein FtsZ
VHAGENDGGPAPAGGRRRPVVFDEDDDLDVPDFLK